jgi:hypothetical protein
VGGALQPGDRGRRCGVAEGPRGGAKVFEPLHEAFWGDYTGQFIDPFGHRWAID